MTQRIIIAGYGYLGTRIAKVLLRSDDEIGRQNLKIPKIYALSRTASERCRDSGGIEPVNCDLRNEQNVHDLSRHFSGNLLFNGTPNASDLIIYCVAPGTVRGSEGRSLLSDSSRIDSYRATYIDGLHNLQRAFQRVGQKLPRLIYISSTGVYGYTDGRIVDDNTPRKANRATAKVLIAAEDQALSQWPQSLIFRLSGIYGPGRTHIRRYLDYATASKTSGDRCRMAGSSERCETDPVSPIVTAERSLAIAAYVEGRGPWTNRIHVDDAASVIAHFALAKHSDANKAKTSQRSFILSDALPVQKLVVANWLRQQVCSDTFVPKDKRDTINQQKIAAATKTDAMAPDHSRTQHRNKYIIPSRLFSMGISLRYPDYKAGYASMDLSSKCC